MRNCLQYARWMIVVSSFLEEDHMREVKRCPFFQLFLLESVGFRFWVKALYSNGNP